MIISHQHNGVPFICLNPPKTGTGLREQVLANYGKRDEYRHLNVSRAQQYLESKQLGTLNDYFCFTFVRNPWRRMESWYQMLLSRQPLQIPNEKHFFSCIKSLLSFSGSKNNGTLRSYIYEKNECRMDYIGSLENIQSDFPIILRKINIELPFKLDNYSPPDKYLRQHINSLWTEESIEYVAEKEKDVIKLKNYFF